VHADAYLESEPADPVADRHRAAYGAARRIERSEEPVAGRVHFDAVVPAELAPDRRVVPLDDLPPATIAELGGPDVRSRCL